jgi:hypothetical protein
MCSEELRDLPPAPKLVLRTLKDIGPATRPEITEETYLPESTTRDALRRLQERSVVQELGSPEPSCPTYDVVDGEEVSDA